MKCFPLFGWASNTRLPNIHHDNSPYELRIATTAFFQDAGEHVHDIIPEESIDLIERYDAL